MNIYIIFHEPWYIRTWICRWISNVLVLTSYWKNKRSFHSLKPCNKIMIEGIYSLIRVFIGPMSVHNPKLSSFHQWANNYWLLPKYCSSPHCNNRSMNIQRLKNLITTVWFCFMPSMEPIQQICLLWPQIYSSSALIRMTQFL